MRYENDLSSENSRIKAFRWLYCFSLVQLMACFAFPVIFFGTARIKVLVAIQLLNALTVGLLFGLHFLAVNIYGMFVDKNRRPLYTAIIIYICFWAIWAAISWAYIEHMGYLT